MPDKIAANNELSGALSRLLLVVERYPDLKSNQNFLHLQDELAGTENRIAVERMRYNEAVKIFNQTIKSFPANLLAGMFGFREAAFFDAPKEAKTAPRFSLATHIFINHEAPEHRRKCSGAFFIPNSYSCYHPITIMNLLLSISSASVLLVLKQVI